MVDSDPVPDAVPCHGPGVGEVLPADIANSNTAPADYDIVDLNMVLLVPGIVD